MSASEKLQPGLTIAEEWKFLLFLLYFVVFYVVIGFFRREPFIMLYVLIPLFTASSVVAAFWGILWFSKFILLMVGLVAVTLLRIAHISEEDSHQNSRAYKLILPLKKYTVFGQWFVAIMLFLNIAWAVYVDVASKVYDVYPNAICGAILALSVPLPAFKDNYVFIKKYDQFYDMLVADNHWLWITVYTSWNLLFGWNYSYNLYAILLHLAPCYVYTITNPHGNMQWDLWLEIRIINICFSMMLSPGIVINGITPILGEYFQLNNDFTKMIWSSINLFFAVVWMGFWIADLVKKYNKKKEDDEDSNDEGPEKEALQVV